LDASGLSNAAAGTGVLSADTVAPIHGYAMARATTNAASTLTIERLFSNGRKLTTRQDARLFGLIY
jgi:hypothetical protein